MDDAFLFLIRWIHIIAATAWLGGGIFYWAVLRPALRIGGVPAGVRQFIATEFGQIVSMSMWTLVITGGIFAFMRLADPRATVAYGAVLAVKMALAAWMFFIAINRRRQTAPPTVEQPRRLRKVVWVLGHVNMTVVLGLVVFLLSGLLRFLIEWA